MEYRARYSLIGAFVLACILAGFGFVYWIANTGGIGARTVYAVRFSEPVPGLAAGASVLFNGVRVGTISSVTLDPNDPRQLTAMLSVDPAAPVRADTVAEASFQGLTGTAAIALKGGSPQAPRLTGQNGQPPLIVAAPGAGASLTDSARATLNRLDAVIDDNAKPLNTAVSGIAAFADMLGRNSKRVEDMLGGLEGLLGGGKKDAPPTYDLAAPADFPGLERTIAAQVVVGDVNAVLAFDTQKILTRSAAGTYVAVADAQWADTLPKLVQAKLVQSFENAHQLGSVSRPLDQLNPEYRLDVSIRAFQLGADGKANVELAARLVSDKGAVKAAKIFSATVAAKGDQPAEAVAALNRAFAQVAADMVRWTVAEV
jgi:phospholipid/cholesterol/gamma-HCH transport system substrate-binding protein